MILFRELLLLAVGRREALSEAPSAADWHSAWHLARRQQLQAVLYDAACRLPEGVRPPAALDEVWRKSADSVAVMSELNYKLCCELDSMLKTAGVSTCVLKGQALASYYPRPASRFGGDIDLWIDLGHRAFVKKARAEDWKLSDIVYQECSLSYSRSVNVDVHFRPARMYNPFRNRRLQTWFSAQAPLQFALPSGGERPFAVPTAGFNAVYLCVHIFRHAVDGGVALRQVLDYYYVLKALTPEERREAFDTLCSAGIGRFVGELMYVLVNLFEAPEEMLLCPPDTKSGPELLHEIATGGSSGRRRRESREYGHSRLHRFITRTKSQFHYLARYPGEILWGPLYRLWHFFWRALHGYL